MKLNKKTKLVFILVALFLIGLSVPSYSWTRKNVKEIETFYNSKLSPIIMIPGSSATENRFDGLVRKLNQDRRGTKHSLLKVKVWNNGIRPLKPCRINTISIILKGWHIQMVA